MRAWCKGACQAGLDVSCLPVWHTAWISSDSLRRFASWSLDEDLWQGLWLAGLLRGCEQDPADTSGERAKTEVTAKGHRAPVGSW